MQGMTGSSSTGHCIKEGKRMTKVSNQKVLLFALPDVDAFFLLLLLFHSVSLLYRVPFVSVVSACHPSTSLDYSFQSSQSLVLLLVDPLHSTPSVSIIPPFFNLLDCSRTASCSDSLLSSHRHGMSVSICIFPVH